MRYQLFFGYISFVTLPDRTDDILAASFWAAGHKERIPPRSFAVFVYFACVNLFVLCGFAPIFHLLISLCQRLNETLFLESSLFLLYDSNFPLVGAGQ